MTIRTTNNAALIFTVKINQSDTSEETRQSSLDYEDTFTQRYSEKPRTVHCGVLACQDPQVTMTGTILKTLKYISAVEDIDKEMPICLFRNPNKYETSKTNIC